VGVFRKPGTAQGGEPDGESPNRSANIREAGYVVAYRMSVADCMLHHQKRIVFEKVRWMGVTILKNPLDCWIYKVTFAKVYQSPARGMDRPLG